MDEKTKKIVFFLGSLIVAVMFISSYAAFGNNGGTTTTTTVKQQAAYFSTGMANATIVNYSYIANVTLLNTSNSVKEGVVGTLSKLEANGSIQNYVTTGSGYQAILYGISPYGLMQQLYANSSLNGSVEVGAVTYVKIPKTVTLYYGNQPIPVKPSSSSYSIYMPNVQAEGSTVNVTISALLEKNGSIYGNEFRIGLGSASSNSTNVGAGNSTINATISNSTLNTTVGNTTSYNTTSTINANGITSTNATNSTASNSIANTNGSTS